MRTKGFPKKKRGQTNNKKLRECKIMTALEVMGREEFIRPKFSWGFDF
jgi:hypothetical protein